MSIKKISISPELLNTSKKTEKKRIQKANKMSNNTLNANKIKLALINKIKEKRQNDLKGTGSVSSSLEQVKSQDENSDDNFSNAVRFMNSFSNNKTLKNNNTFDEPITYSPYKIDTDIPYGCLRGGKKMGYKNWNQTLRRKEVINREPIIEENPIVSPFTEDIEKSERELKLEILKKKMEQMNKQDLEPPKTLSVVSGGSSGKTIRKKFTLGKSNKYRILSVLIKDNKTRKNISHAKKELKSAQIKDVKKYLRHHGLIKNGSTAPIKVLRSIYESSMMTGNIYNIDKDILLQNCLEENENKL